MSSAYSFLDPTHVRHFTFRTLDHFCGDSWGKLGLLESRLLRTFGFDSRPHIHRFYVSFRFRYLEARLVFPRVYRMIGIESLANRFPDFYELYLMWRFPCRDLHFVLEVVK